MKKIILFLLVCSVCYSVNEVGWKGSNLTLGGLSFNGKSIEVTSDNQVIDVGNTSVFVLSSDSPVGNQRNILLTEPKLMNGSSGVHEITLIYEDSASDKINLDDNEPISGGSGVVKLSSLWNPNNGDTLTLVYFSPDWREKARSNN